MLLCAFTVLIISLLSLWVKKSPWVWGTLSLISLLFAQTGHLFTSGGLLLLGIATACFLFLYPEGKKPFRFLIFVTAILLTAMLCSCLISGVPPCKTIFGVQANYGKLFLAVPVGGLLLSLAGTDSFRPRTVILYSTLILSGVASIVACFFFALTPSFFSVFRSMFAFLPKALPYLLCNVIPEEILFRGFLQKEMFRYLGKGVAARIIAVMVSAGSYALFHLTWISAPSVFGAVFFAGCIYAALYQITETVETSIVCRFLAGIICAGLITQGNLL